MKDLLKSDLLALQIERDHRDFEIVLSRLRPALRREKFLKFVNLCDFAPKRVSPIQLRAQKIFARCFSLEDLEFLQRNAEFNQATENIENLEDAFAALELGGRLTSEAWIKLNYPDGFSRWVRSAARQLADEGFEPLRNGAASPSSICTLRVRQCAHTRLEASKEKSNAHFNIPQGDNKAAPHAGSSVL